jgi:DNA polymerase III subunit epsilon
MLDSFDDLGTPLHQVTFCVVDLETTGASAATCEITEVAAARFRGGECLGTFQTLVDPGAPIEPAVSALTGITDAMVRTAPPVSTVLPSLAEFVGGAVLVGHNVRFDVSFLDAALALDERERIGLRTIDTVGLARRLLRDDTPDCRLATLARVLRLDHAPTHRALDDVLATADLLHVLLERAATFGVTLLDDLVQLPRLTAHPQAAKLCLTNRLPRGPGVAVFRDGQGQVLQLIGAHDDLRGRVRSLFAGDDQRTAGALLREMHAIDHVACATALAAQVAEARLVHALAPRRLEAGRDPGSNRYVTPGSGRSRSLTVARRLPATAVRHLGPLPSAAAARAVVEAVATAVDDVGVGVGVGTLPGPGDSDRACPVGAVDDRGGDSRRRRRERLVVDDVFDAPARVVHRLAQRADDARAAGRPAQARSLDAMAVTVADAVGRQRRIDALRRAERAVLVLPDGATVEIDGGRLVHPWAEDARAGTSGRITRATDDLVRLLTAPPDAPLAPDASTPPHLAGELACLADWVHDNGHLLTVAHVAGELACPLPRVPLDPAPADLGLRCPAC